MRLILAVTTGGSQSRFSCLQVVNITGDPVCVCKGSDVCVVKYIR
jgi:hypothetical protein